MAYSDWTQFPRGRKVIAALGSTPQAVFAATVLAKITHISISGGSADRDVTFRAIDNSPNVVIVAVPAGDTVTIPGWQVDGEGLEVLTDDVTTDVNLTVFTVDPTIS